jgi:hypothetical protein
MLLEINKEQLEIKNNNLNQEMNNRLITEKNKRILLTQQVQQSQM